MIDDCDVEALPRGTNGEVVLLGVSASHFILVTWFYGVLYDLSIDLRCCCWFFARSGVDFLKDLLG